MSIHPFKLLDGKPVWAIAQYEERNSKDKNDVVIVRTINLFNEDEITMHPECVRLPPVPLELIERAAKIEGMTYSKSEFERLLAEKTQDELLQEQIATQQAIIDMLVLDALGGGSDVGDD